MKPLSDIALVRVFTDAKREMGLPGALRAVIAAAQGRHRADTAYILAVTDAVADTFGSTREALLGNDGADRYRLSLPRQVAWWVCHRHGEAELSAIGSVYCGRNHSTISKQLDRFRELMVGDAALRDLVERVSVAARATAAWQGERSVG